MLAISALFYDSWVSVFEGVLYSFSSRKEKAKCNYGRWKLGVAATALSIFSQRSDFLFCIWVIKNSLFYKGVFHFIEMIISKDLIILTCFFHIAFWKYILLPSYWYAAGSNTYAINELRISSKSPFSLSDRSFISSNKSSRELIEPSSSNLMRMEFPFENR